MTQTHKESKVALVTASYVTEVDGYMKEYDLSYDMHNARDRSRLIALVTWIALNGEIALRITSDMQSAQSAQSAQS